MNAMKGDYVVESENRLFKTLDIFSEELRLNNNLSIIGVDTIGFITDLPTQLGAKTPL
jgi:50S ribosomal subunit-associated GTPase HflX